MKPLSRQERVGVLALATVTVAVIGGGFLLRQYSATRSRDAAPVTVVYADTTGGANVIDSEETSGAARDSSKKRRGNKSYRKKPTHSRRVSSRTRSEYEVRDPLSDTISLQPQLP